MKKLTAFLILALFAGASILEAREAILSGFKGKVEVQKKSADMWIRAQAKMRLKEGEKIRTGSRSEAVLIFEDGSKTTLFEKTVLNLSQLVAPVNLEQTAGRTRNKVKKTGRGFTMRTPTAVCSVRGTNFLVGVSDGRTDLAVLEGTVNGLLLATGESVDVGAGQSLIFQGNTPLGSPSQTETQQGGALRDLAKKEVGLDMTRDQIQALAAEEMKLAQYQEGKSLIDVNGYRTRIEEYVTRKDATGALLEGGKAFKFVVLTKREDLGRLDYFTYRGVFNKVLPDDLSMALRSMQGKIGTQPEYWLNTKEVTWSNVADAMRDVSDGGHLVKVTFDGSNYILTPLNPDGTAGADNPVQLPTNSNGYVYDPVADIYKDSGSNLEGVYDLATDSFKNLAAGETYWRPVFNRYVHLVGQASEIANVTLNQAEVLADAANGGGAKLSGIYFQFYQPKTGVTNVATLAEVSLTNANPRVGSAITRSADTTITSIRIGADKSLTVYPDGTFGDASFNYLNGRYAFDSVFPGGPNFHQKITTYYPRTATDIAFEQYDTYIIADDGKIAPFSAFANASTGRAFKTELVKWNYQQIARSSQWGGTASNPDSSRTIDLVVEPKILIRSGLIK